MRVAYVCADPGIPVWGTKGASAHVRAVIRALVRRGAHVTVFATRTGGAAPADLADLEVVALPAVGAGPAAEREQRARAANAGLGAALRGAGHVDLVYERYSLWSTAGMAHAAGTPGTVGLLEVNAPLVEEQARHRALHDPEAALAAARLTLGRADAVVAVSAPVAAWATDLGARTVAVVPNGVDVRRFGPVTHGVARRPFTIAFVGTLKPWHGVEHLVEAVRRIGASGDTPPHLLVVGDGPQRVGLERAVAEAGLSATTVLTGAVDPDEVPRLLAHADVGAAPYPAGGDAYFSPLKVVEYLGAGLPVVGSDVGQLPELLDEGRAGTLCPPGDVEAMAAAFVALRDDPALRARMGAHGRSLATTRHSWDAVVARSLDLVGLADTPGRGVLQGRAS